MAKQSRVCIHNGWNVGKVPPPPPQRLRNNLGDMGIGAVKKHANSDGYKASTG